MPDRDLLLPLRKLKHLGFLGLRRARRAEVSVRNHVYARYGDRVPYRFDVDRHRNRVGELPRMYFLHRDSPTGTTDAPRPAPRRLFLLWTGHNEISPNRRAGIASIREANRDLEVVLVTPENLPEWLIPGQPLHPAYAHLSLVHRSDYLRAYLLHHHGGAYADIKPMTGGFGPAIDLLGTDPDAWVVGYREISSDLVGGRDARLGPELRHRYRSIAGAGAFATRPGTPLTGEWLREVERRLAYYAEELAEHPGDAVGSNPGYPIQWIELGADILYPLEIKHLSHLRYDDSLHPRTENHR